MSDTHDDLSHLPPATLRAALNASEGRIRREKEKIQSEIRKLQKRLEELEEGENPPPETGLEKSVAGGSQRKVKRPRVDSSSDNEVVDEKYGRTKARRVDPGPVSSQRYVCSGDETLVVTGCTFYRAQCARSEECVANGEPAPPFVDVSLVNFQAFGAI